jgi:hypothetical protein
VAEVGTALGRHGVGAAFAVDNLITPLWRIGGGSAVGASGSFARGPGVFEKVGGLAFRRWP